MTEALIIPIRIDRGPCGLSLCNTEGCKNWCARHWPHTSHQCLDHIENAFGDFNRLETEKLGVEERYAVWRKRTNANMAAGRSPYDDGE